MFSFRPLDGESFSKPLDNLMSGRICIGVGFRPLDGESFSKLCTSIQISTSTMSVSVP